MTIGIDLSGAANKMYRIASAQGERTTDQLAKVAKNCVDAAGQAYDAAEYRQVVQAAVSIRASHADEMTVVLGPSDDSKSRFDEFIVKERGVLRLAGLESELVEESLARGSEVVNQAHNWPGNAQRFLGQVDQLRKSANDLHKQLTQIIEIEKALARAFEQAGSLRRELEWAHAENQVEQLALNGSKDRTERLESQIAEARHMTRELTDRLRPPEHRDSQHEVRRHAWGIAWNLTFAVVGLVIVYANTTAMQAIGSANAAVSCTLGGVFTGGGVDALRHALFGVS